MKKIIAKSITACLTFLFSNVALAQWVTQTSGTNSYLKAIAFSDNNTGLTVGNSGTILKTTDGGNNWTSLTLKSGTTFNTVCRSSSNIFFIASNDGMILRTTNAGVKWDTVYGKKPNISASVIRTVPLTMNQSILAINTLSFADANIGFAIGVKINPASASQENVYLKTIDGGLTWNTQTLITTASINSMYFINNTIGYAVGENGAIIKTTDGGNSWNNQTSGITNSLKDVYFTDVNTGYAVGGNGAPMIIKTIDGGTTWTNQTVNCKYYLYSVSFKSATTGYAVGGRGTLLYTANGGQTWSIQTTPTTGNLSTVNCVGNKTFIVGEGGVILLNNN